MFNKHKKNFIYGEFFSSSFGATVQHSKTYLENVSEGERSKFRKTLYDQLNNLLPMYKSYISEESHILNIEKISNYMTENYSYILYKNKFRIGSSQKVLNLYLKYMWCFGEILQPPHCPIDSIVLKCLPGCSDIKWTILDTISEYKEIINIAKNKAGDIPLSNWELKIWNDAQPKNEADG